MVYDVIIVGGGVAGLSAALFAVRRGLSALILTKDLGGQTASTAEIENYPGIGRIEGPQLVDNFYQQARFFGVEVCFDEVVGLTVGGDHFFMQTQTADAPHQAHSVILAFGKTPRNIPAIGEEKYRGNGVSYAALWDTPQCAGATVAVIGGGNSALEAATALAGVAAKVYAIHRGDAFRGEQILIDRLKNTPCIEQVLNATVEEVRGSAQVESIIIADVKTGQRRELAVAWVFGAIGFEPKTKFLHGIVACNEAGMVVVDDRGATSCPGIFAAGDVTAVPYQQIVISAGAGATAALSAYQYLNKRRGVRSFKTDWGFLRK